MIFGADDMAVSMSLEAAIAARQSGEPLFPDAFLPYPSPPTKHLQPNSTSTNTPIIAPLSSTSPSQSSTSSGPSSTGTKRQAAAALLEDDAADGDDATVKRQRNTMAARRYRQRRLDRLAELEKKLEEVTSERDDLKVKLARREAEVGALRDVLSAKK